MPGTARSIVAVTLLAAVTACSSPNRSAVQWSDLKVSDDRRTVTVTTWYGSFCHKIADGVDVDVRDDEIVVSAWLRDGELDRDGMCTLECAQVTQTVTLDEPLPDDRPFVPPSGYDLGCGG